MRTAVLAVTVAVLSFTSRAADAAPSEGAPGELSARNFPGGPVDGGGTGVLTALNGDRLAVTVPAGWTLDNRALASQGIHMLFYPAGTGWNGESTPVFAYVMPTVKAEGASVGGLVELRRQQLIEFDPKATVTFERRPGAKRAPEQVTIVRYTTLKLPRHERVAYIEDERVIYAVILSAASAEDLKRWSPFLDAVLRAHKREGPQ
jgi:hypothetical protein